MTKTKNAIASVAGILAVSLLFTVAFAQPASATSTQTINILVEFNNHKVAGATCTVVTNASPIPIQTTSGNNGVCSVQVPLSATMADITATSNSHTGQGQFQLTPPTTSVIIYLT